MPITWMDIETGRSGEVVMTRNPSRARRLPHFWPGKERVLLACAELRLAGVPDDWVKEYRNRSRSQMKATYGTFRDRYNDTMNRLAVRGKP